jgi:hypothetical protein
VREPDLTDLEASIKKIEGVLGCVILINPSRGAYEIHAFTATGADGQALEAAIVERAENHPLKELLSRIFLFELDAELDSEGRLLNASDFDRPKTASRPSASVHFPARPSSSKEVTPGNRPLLVRVSLTPTIGRSIAKVALEEHAGEVTGEASGELPPHGLELLADATIDAVTNLVGVARFSSRGASLIELAGARVVVVLIDELDGPQLVGAALVREESVTEAAVRATLAALNRRLELGR